MNHQMIDRSIQPQTYSIGSLTLPHFEQRTLDNGVEMCLVTGGTQDIVKIDFCFNAGSVFAPKCGLARAVNVLLGEGIPGMNAEEIAEKIEFYGANMWQRSSYHNSALSLFVLDKHIERILPIIEKMIKEPTFPEKGLSEYVDRLQQQFRIRMRRSNYLVGHTMTQNLYEEGSIFGRVMDENTLSQLTTDDLHAFHKAAYSQNGMRISISGKPSEKSIESIAKTFGSTWRPEVKVGDCPTPVYREWTENPIIINREGSTQASILMACPFLPIGHPDVQTMSFVNMILGGYFGSRLMQNIREKKGLTYGINSITDIHRDFGLLKIASEVEPNSCDVVIGEIFAEMNRMCTEPIDEEELMMARNYVKGVMYQNYETTFSSADSINSLILEGAPYDYDLRFFNLVDTIDSNKVMEMSQKYLKKENFRIVVVR